jgi:PAS domain-containing protein
VTVGVALLLPLALELGSDLQELAGAALGACVLQAVVLWVLRRRATAARQRLIDEVRGLLRDRINNHLQVVLFSLAEQDESAARADRDRLAQAMTAVAAVSRTLDELSTDSLRAWQERYREALQATPPLDGDGAYERWTPAASRGTGGSRDGLASRRSVSR